jgi:pimeloyl-ACP methyl ester carboxylesterase
MKDKIPQAEIFIIPRAGHLSNLEQEEEFNLHLLNFLRKLQA